MFDLPCFAQAVVVLAGFDRVGMFMCSNKWSAYHKVKHSQRACAILQALSCQTVAIARCVGLSYSLYRYSLNDSPPLPKTRVAFFGAEHRSGHSSFTGWFV